jgi:hypothetical protein
LSAIIKDKRAARVANGYYDDDIPDDYLNFISFAVRPKRAAPSFIFKLKIILSFLQVSE